MRAGSRDIYLELPFLYFCPLPEEMWGIWEAGIANAVSCPLSCDRFKFEFCLYYSIISLGKGVSQEQLIEKMLINLHIRAISAVENVYSWH